MITNSVRAALLVSAAAAALSAQQMPLRDIPKPAKELDDPFTLIAAAREVKGGKLLIADPTEQQVSVVDFTSGSRTPLGRKGAGPGEYTAPMGVYRMAGDTVWVLDIQGGQSGRFVVFLPDAKYGTTFPVTMGFNAVDSTTLTQPFAFDTRGMMYASTLPLKIATAGSASDAGGGRASVQFADSTTLVRFDPRIMNGPRTKLARLRFFSNAGGGGMQQQVVGTNLKMTMAFLGLATGDAWALFADGRIAIVRGSNYRVEFLLPGGKPGAAASIPYDHVKLTDADRKLELDAAKRAAKEQAPTIKKMLPAGWTLEFEVLAPPTWPAEYPPVSPGGVRAAPDGRLWVQRSVPERIGREQWDVIDPAGKLVARWQFPSKTTLIAFGDGGVLYTARTDDDDLRYVQRVELPRCTECR